jgi:hypothetical protein
MKALLNYQKKLVKLAIMGYENGQSVLQSDKHNAIKRITV